MADRDGPKSPPSLLIRLAWFAALWAAGVAAVGLLALLIRSIIRG